VTWQQQGRTTVRLFLTYGLPVPTVEIKPSWLGPDPKSESSSPIPTLRAGKSELVEAVLRWPA